MAIIYEDFQPSDNAPFQFTAVLDGTQYNIIVTYNVFGQRFYANVYDIQGTLIFSVPVVGSPTGFDIDILAGKFTSTLVFREDASRFEVSDQAIQYPNFGVRVDVMLDILNAPFILDQSTMM